MMGKVGAGGWGFCYPNLNKLHASHMGRSLFLIGLLGFFSLISDIYGVRLKISFVFPCISLQSRGTLGTWSK